MRTRTIDTVPSVLSDKKRVPINGTRDSLKAEGIPENLHECWVNEYNIQRYLAAGYAFYDGDVTIADVKIDTDSQFGKRIAKNVGNGLTGFLMVIPKEFYTEDLEAMHREIDDKESIMFRSMKEKPGQYDKGTKVESELVKL